MKKNVRTFLYNRHKNIMFDDGCPQEDCRTIDCWPDIKLCVETHYKNHPGIRRYHDTEQQPIEFQCSKKFMRSLNKYCTTDTLKLRLIHALTKIVYKIRCGGLCDTAIKERTDLWHFYVTNFWRVFYRKKNDYILLEELCSHKKLSYYRDR